MLGLLAGLGITVIIFVVATVAVIMLFGVASGANLHVMMRSTGYLVANLAITVVAGAAGGYVVSRATGGKSRFAVLVLALILLVSGLAAARKDPTPQGRPEWHAWTMPVMSALGVTLGALVARRRQSAGELS